ncbi:MerR family transcriptional regulator [Vibrio cholerae]
MQRSYTIKQFEKVTDVSAHTLRYFDKVGLLSPQREPNGYRRYSVAQVAQAEMIVLLQQATFSNGQIKRMLEDYQSLSTLESLIEHHKKLRQEIVRMRQVYRSLGDHIEDLQRLTTIRGTLNQPQIEQLGGRDVGLIIPAQPRDIVDYFDEGDDIMEDPAWPHFYSHGVLVDLAKVDQGCYPFEAMFVENTRVHQLAPYHFPAGEYLTMTCAGSMENNPHITDLLNYARQHHFTHSSTLIIQQVTGPVIEKNKQDFLVKLLLRREPTVPSIG